MEMVERGREVTLGSLQLRLPTPEDLIIMKAVAYRPKDLADIQAIAASHPDLDKDRIRFWVEQFAEALDFPNLWNEINKLL
jgi:predicted nucleotidyltransferase